MLTAEVHYSPIRHVLQSLTIPLLLQGCKVFSLLWFISLRFYLVLQKDHCQWTHGSWKSTINPKRIQGGTWQYPASSLSWTLLAKPWINTTSVQKANKWQLYTIITQWLLITLPPKMTLPLTFSLTNGRNCWHHRSQAVSEARSYHTGQAEIHRSVLTLQKQHLSECLLCNLSWGHAFNWRDMSFISLLFERNNR